MFRVLLVTAVLAVNSGVAHSAEIQVGTCKTLAAPTRQSATDAAEFLQKARILRMTPDQDFAAYFSGPELQAAQALAATYGPLLPQLEAYTNQIAIFASVMEACAAKAP